MLFRSLSRLLGELAATSTSTSTPTPAPGPGVRRTGPGSAGVRCTVCGTALDGDPEDDPWSPGGALCGECFRAREMDEELWMSEEG